MGMIMKNSIRVTCSRCGITERHRQPEVFVDNGWTVRNYTPYCPQCKQKIDEYEEFIDYVDYLRRFDRERIEELRKELS